MSVAGFRGKYRSWNVIHGGQTIECGNMFLTTCRFRTKWTTWGWIVGTTMVNLERIRKEG